MEGSGCGSTGGVYGEAPRLPVRLGAAVDPTDAHGKRHGLLCVCCREDRVRKSAEKLTKARSVRAVGRSGPQRAAAGGRGGGLTGMGLRAGANARAAGLVLQHHPERFGQAPGEPLLCSFSPALNLWPAASHAPLDRLGRRPRAPRRKPRKGRKARRWQWPGRSSWARNDEPSIVKRGACAWAFARMRADQAGGGGPNK